MRRSFIDNRTYDAGEEIEYDGIPAANLEAIDKDAKAAAKDAQASGINTSVAEDWNPDLSIADPLAGTSAGATAPQPASAQ